MFLLFCFDEADPNSATDTNIKKKKQQKTGGDSLMVRVNGI